MRLAEPAWLILLVLALLPFRRERRRARIAWPSLAGFADDRGKRPWSLRRMMTWVPAMLRALAIASLVVALARPQGVGGVVKVASRGVAVVVALDHSSSMNAADFPADGGLRRVSRLRAAKETLVRFVEGRPDDLIGLVVFAGYPDLACPATLDHRFLIDSAQAVRPARPGDDGTSLGDAVAWSLAALRQAPPAKKVLILLTDGNDEPANPRPVPPMDAAGFARDLGVTLHTIAVGRPGGVKHGTDARTGRPLAVETEGPNIELLQAMADVAGGRSFVATDADALDDVFRALDAMEKSRIQDEVHTRYDELFFPWAAAAVVLLGLDRILAAGALRRTP